MSITPSNAVVSLKANHFRESRFALTDRTVHQGPVDGVSVSMLVDMVPDDGAQSLTRDGCQASIHGKYSNGWLGRRRRPVPGVCMVADTALT